MNRVIMLLPDDLLAALDAAVKSCGCGSRSVHLRHVLSTILKK